MPPIPAHGFQRREEIDLGLEVIEAVQTPGVGLSCGDIAAVCGCSPQAIRHILKRAVRKMRARALEIQSEQAAAHPTSNSPLHR